VVDVSVGAACGGGASRRSPRLAVGSPPLPHPSQSKSDGTSIANGPGCNGSNPERTAEVPRNGGGNKISPTASISEPPVYVGDGEERANRTLNLQCNNVSVPSTVRTDTATNKLCHQRQVETPILVNSVAANSEPLPTAVKNSGHNKPIESSCQKSNQKTKVETENLQQGYTAIGPAPSPVAKG
jgi:hypothetical protein